MRIDLLATQVQISSNNQESDRLKTPVPQPVVLEELRIGDRLRIRREVRAKAIALGIGDIFEVQCNRLGAEEDPLMILTGVNCITGVLSLPGPKHAGVDWATAFERLPVFPG